MHVGPNVIHSFMYKYIYTFIHACICAYALCICMCVFTCSILGYSFLPLFFLSFLASLLPSLYFLTSLLPGVLHYTTLLPCFLLFFLPTVIHCSHLSIHPFFLPVVHSSTASPLRALSPTNLL